MNIVYGVSGEGLGHVFEAIEIATLLREDGHQVKVLTFGSRALHSLAAFQPTRIEGIHLHFGARGLSLPKTLRHNLRCFPFYLKNGRRLMRELAAFKPDVFITAYEPFTTLASHRLRKPLISMDNQNELRFLPRPAGADAFAFHLAHLATRVVTYGAADYIVKSFNRRAPGMERVHLVAPMIQKEIRRLQPTYGSHVLVYLTKPNPGLVEILKSIDETFVVYCHDRVGEDRNIIYRAQGPDYLRDLGGCKAVIGTTGFSLIADCIYLKKPYFGVPLKKQFEQTLNAHFLRKSGMGEYSEAVTRDELGRFLARLPDYREKLAGYDLDPAEQEETLRELLAKFEDGIPADLRARITVFSPGA
jgi:uncharacterized protein (TIGR00661 family)